VSAVASRSPDVAVDVDAILPPRVIATNAPEDVLLGDPSDEALVRQLLGNTLKPPRWILPAMAVTGTLSLTLFAALTYTAVAGIGVWGNNIPVAWAFGITNFVWWIGIGHAGTFISAFLLLLEQKWRTSINRFAEGMTLFAIVQAGLFPIFHLGRPWFAYWLFPYPSTMGVWPQFRSALTWDVVAVSTYFTISLLFWFLGLVPDFAKLRDHAAETWRRRVYGVFALGWYGSTEQWNRWRIGYGLLGGLACPLVVSVHSVVSMDFATAQMPGWHSLIFPPFFVAGAILSGFAMVLTLLLPARHLYRLQNVITRAHLDAMGKMLLVTAWIVTYSYAIEFFMGWYSGDHFERYLALQARPFGFYGVCYWITIFCNCLVPQLLWFPRVRVNAKVLWGITLFIQLGMWMERFVLIVGSEAQDFLTSSWHTYRPSIVDGSILFGTVCFFLFLFLAFLRYVPFIPISELQQMRREMDEEERQRREVVAELTHG
jgi:Ni/Fe-hydrogenase subunit HybB-like protein